MMKEHDRREHLKTLDEDERRKEEEHYDEMKKKHADHPKVNHPVRAAGDQLKRQCCDFPAVINFILVSRYKHTHPFPAQPIDQ